MTGGLHERDAECGAIAAALAGVVDRGRGGALFFRAEPGLGKTSLLRSAAAAADRLAVVRAGGHEMEQAYPYAVVHQVVESLVGAYGARGRGLVGQLRSLRLLLRRSMGAGVAGGAPESALARSELLQGLYWLVSSLAERRPLLLCLDDLHWSDPDSLEALRFLAMRLEPLPVLVLGALRPWPLQAAEVVGRLGRDAHATVYDLAPLSAAACADLLGHAFGEPPSRARAERAYALTSGNPFLLEELVRVWQAESAGAAGPGPSGGRSLVLARLAGLPAASMRLLQAGSVLGPDFGLDAALALAGVPTAEARAAVEPVDALGLLRWGGGGRAAFLHPLLHQAVYAGLPPPDRLALHREAVRLLRAGGAPAVEIAPHVARIAHPGDAEALADLRAAAGEAASLGAWDSATIHLRCAAAVVLPGPERARVLYEMGRTQQIAGAQQDACAAFAEAAATGGCTARLRALVLRSWGFSLTLTGQEGAAREHLKEAVAAALGTDPVLAAEIAVARVVFEMTTSGMRHAEEAAAEALRLAERSGDAAVTAKAWAAWSNVAFQRGDPRAYERVREAHTRLADVEPDESEILWGWSPRIALGMIAMRSERYAEAEAPLLEAWELAGTRRTRVARLWASTFLAELGWRRGRLHDAFRYACDPSAQTSETPWATALAFAVRGFVLLEMGDLDGADAVLARAEADARHAGLGAALRSWATARAVLLARRGSIDAAMAIFAEQVAAMEALGIADLDSLRWCREAAEVFIRGGRPDEGRRLAEQLLAGARRLGRIGAAAAAWRCLGLLAGVEGRDADAETAFTTSLALYRQTDEALERGRTLLAYGSWLRRSGEMRRARGILDEACVVCEACGGAYWLRQAESERRSAGGRRRARPDAGHLGWLTPQEYRVTELVHQGHSNRQIACLLLISPKTLETHLSHIYGKLGVATRAELKEHFGSRRSPPAVAAGVAAAGAVSPRAVAGGAAASAVHVAAGADGLAAAVPPDPAAAGVPLR